MKFLILALLATVVAAQEPPYPLLVTSSSPELEKPGKIFFRDGFESDASLTNYFEIVSLKDGRAKRTTDPQLAHTGHSALQFTAPDKAGKESLTGASLWFGPIGYDRVYFRRYIKFAADYDQGDLNHVGGGIEGVAGANKWADMGKAGIRPTGDDRFSCRFEPWRDWGRYTPPGYMFLYTYWMDMKRDPDGHYWGNNLKPADDKRITLERNRWYCLEHMIKVNDLGQANGELAAWIDGKLYIHYKGFRWRSAEDVKIKRAHIGLYVHHAKQANTVWYDDVALSTGYIGPIKR
jgi:hypothetical protein